MSFRPVGKITMPSKLRKSRQKKLTHFQRLSQLGQGEAREQIQLKKRKSKRLIDKAFRGALTRSELHKDKIKKFKSIQGMTPSVFLTTFEPSDFRPREGTGNDPRFTYATIRGKRPTSKVLGGVHNQGIPKSLEM